VKKAGSLSRRQRYVYHSFPRRAAVRPPCPHHSGPSARQPTILRSSIAWMGAQKHSLTTATRYLISRQFHGDPSQERVSSPSILIGRVMSDAVVYHQSTTPPPLLEPVLVCVSPVGEPVTSADPAVRSRAVSLLLVPRWRSPAQRVGTRQGCCRVPRQALVDRGHTGPPVLLDHAERRGTVAAGAKAQVPPPPPVPS